MDRPKTIELTPTLESILKGIMGQYNGLLPTEAVVEAARPKTSALHEYFTWDDTEAAEKWRQREAINLISSFKIYNEELQIPVRAFTSLEVDRKNGDGYRWTTDVLERPNLRAQLIETAMHELKSTERRYQHLIELAEVWSAVEETEAALKRKR